MRVFFGFAGTKNNSVTVPQDMLHILYLTADEYTRAGPPDFMASNNSRGVDYQWTDMLAYLPNPSNEPLPSRFTGYSVLHLLPSYAYVATTRARVFQFVCQRLTLGGCPPASQVCGRRAV